jgi:hypothetical protein
VTSVTRLIRDPACGPIAPVAAASAPAPSTRLGLWATEANNGNVRIERCGANLCGYAKNSGEKILINMKPSDNKRGDRLHDPEGGSNCDATIAMKGPGPLKVRGLRVRWPVLRRPDPEARRLNPSARRASQGIRGLSHRVRSSIEHRFLVMELQHPWIRFIFTHHDK